MTDRPDKVEGNGDSGAGDASRSPELQGAHDSAARALAEIATYRDSARSIAAEGAERLAAMTSILDDGRKRIDELREISARVVAIEAKLNDLQAVVATKSEHIEDARRHADDVRSALDRALTTANSAATSAEGHRDTASTASVAAAAQLAELRSTKSTADVDAASISDARRNSETWAASTKTLADMASSVQEKLNAYETNLAQLQERCESQLRTIESLLPGATSAGLASAFDERRKLFRGPNWRWQLLFIVSVLALVGLAATGLWHVLQADRPPSYEEILRLWLARAPVAGALVWLALHASRESALAKRLEEDYGFKAASAACLEGFQKRMEAVTRNSSENPALSLLLTNTLSTIAQPPGRIYDKHKLVVTPSDEAARLASAAAKTMAEAARMSSRGPKSDATT